MTDLTERDLEVLCELVSVCDDCNGGRDRESGVAPIQLGGTGHSNHSYRLTKLALRGYAEHRMRGHEWGDVSTRDARGSKVYRPTDKGREAAKQFRLRPKA